MSKLHLGLFAGKIGLPRTNLSPMKSTIPSIRRLGPVPGKSCLRAKLYPNGEVSIWKEKTYKPESVKPYRKPAFDPLSLTMFRMYVEQPQVLEALAGPMGLSPLRNFDKLISRVSAPKQPIKTVVKRYGRKGITSYGARRVRNGCYVLERAVPKMSAVFATCTVPAMPFEEMATLHHNWNQVVEVYRRKLTRRLRDNGLSGESVTVSEIQGKRYENTGIPVLHLHTVFHGRMKTGKPAISTEDHDEMWRDALMVGLRGPIPPLRSACNLQWVEKSAEGYLGKYMSKGSKAVGELCKAGFEGWLPKQWWAMSRSLAARVDRETRDIKEFALWLNDIAEVEGSDVWLWHRDVQIEMMSGDKITIARYGRLSIRQTAEIHMYYQMSSP